MYRVAWLVALGGDNAAGGPRPQDTVRNSVVKIHAQQRLPDFASRNRPWVKSNPRDVTGSGAIIEGKRILTNTHVGLCQPGPGATRPVHGADSGNGRGHCAGIDLAVLKLSNEAIFDKRPPLLLDDSLPKNKNTVNAYGYPEGAISSP